MNRKQTIAVVLAVVVIVGLSFSIGWLKPFHTQDEEPSEQVVIHQHYHDTTVNVTVVIHEHGNHSHSHVVNSTQNSSYTTGDSNDPA